MSAFRGMRRAVWHAHLTPVAARACAQRGSLALQNPVPTICRSLTTSNPAPADDLARADGAAAGFSSLLARLPAGDVGAADALALARDFEAACAGQAESLPLLSRLARDRDVAAQRKEAAAAVAAAAAKELQRGPRASQHFRSAFTPSGDVVPPSSPTSPTPTRGAAATAGGALLARFSRARHLAAADSVWTSMRRRGLCPPSDALEAWLCLLTDEGRPADSRVQLERALGLGAHPTRGILREAMRACLEMEDLAGASDLWYVLVGGLPRGGGAGARSGAAAGPGPRLLTPTADDYNAFLAVASRVGGRREILHLLDGMRASAATLPTETSYILAFEGLARSGHPHKAFSLFDRRGVRKDGGGKAAGDGIAVGPRTFASLARVGSLAVAASARGAPLSTSPVDGSRGGRVDGEEARAVFSDGPKPPSPAARVEMAEEAWRLLAREPGLTPTLAVHAAVIAEAAEAGSLPDAYAWLQRLREAPAEQRRPCDGAADPAEPYASVARACIPALVRDRRHAALAEAVVRQALDDGHFSDPTPACADLLSALVRVTALLGDTRRSIALFENLRLVAAHVGAARPAVVEGTLAALVRCAGLRGGRHFEGARAAAARYRESAGRLPQSIHVAMACAAGDAGDPSAALDVLQALDGDRVAATSRMFEGALSAVLAAGPCAEAADVFAALEASTVRHNNRLQALLVRVDEAAMEAAGLMDGEQDEDREGGKKDEGRDASGRRGRRGRRGRGAGSRMDADVEGEGEEGEGAEVPRESNGRRGKSGAFAATTGDDLLASSANATEALETGSASHPSTTAAQPGAVSMAATEAKEEEVEEEAVDAAEAEAFDELRFLMASGGPEDGATAGLPTLRRSGPNERARAVPRGKVARMLADKEKEEEGAGGDFHEEEEDGDEDDDDLGADGFSSSADRKLNSLLADAVASCYGKALRLPLSAQGRTVPVPPLSGDVLLSSSRLPLPDDPYEPDVALLRAVQDMGLPLGRFAVFLEAADEDDADVLARAGLGPLPGEEAGGDAGSAMRMSSADELAEEDDEEDDRAEVVFDMSKPIPLNGPFGSGGRARGRADGGEDGEDWEEGEEGEDGAAAQGAEVRATKDVSAKAHARAAAARQFGGGGVAVTKAPPPRPAPTTEGGGKGKRLRPGVLPS
jgi:hypothetical protein